MFMLQLLLPGVFAWEQGSIYQSKEDSDVEDRIERVLDCRCGWCDFLFWKTRTFMLSANLVPT